MKKLALFILLSVNLVACGPSTLFDGSGETVLRAVQDGPILDNDGDLRFGCAEGEAMYLRGDWTQDGALTEEDYLLALATDAPENALLLSCPAVADLDGNGKVERIGGIAMKGKRNGAPFGHAWGKRCKDEDSDLDDLFDKFDRLFKKFPTIEVDVICQSDCALDTEE